MLGSELGFANGTWPAEGQTGCELGFANGAWPAPCLTVMGGVWVLLLLIALILIRIFMMLVRNSGELMNQCELLPSF